MEPCKVYQYPVPLRCANTGAGFFLQFCRKGFKIRFVQIGQKVLISALFKFAAARHECWKKIRILRHMRRSSAFREKPNRKIIPIFAG